jgi:hypothetical protein
MSPADAPLWTVASAAMLDQPIVAPRYRGSACAAVGLALNRRPGPRPGRPTVPSFGRMWPGPGADAAVPGV